MSSVPAALLSGDNEVLQVLAERQQVIDVLYPRIEKLASHEILLQAPVVSGRRFLLSALRIVPELEPGRGQGRYPGCSRPHGRSPVPGQQEADSAGRDHHQAGREGDRGRPADEHR